MRPGRTIFRDVAGFDYFISYNGHLRMGKSLEQVDPDLKCNWHPPMFVSLEQERYREEAVQKHGSYILCYFVFQGTYCYWTKQFPVKSVVEFINRLSRDSGCRPVLVGASWDAKDPSLIAVRDGVSNAVSLLGMTAMEQLFGLIRGAKAVVGYPSGLTIMSAMLSQRTMIIWNDYYNRDFCAMPAPRMPGGRPTGPRTPESVHVSLALVEQPA